MLTPVSLLRRRRGMLVWLVTVVAALVATAVLFVGDDDGEDRTAEQAEAPSRTPAAKPGADPLRSRPDLQPPPVSVDVQARRPGNRVIFVSPRMEKVKRDGPTHQQGALAVDERGRTVWFSPGPDDQPRTDVRVQRYRGRPVLTWWEGAATQFGIGRGRGVIVDQSYRQIATVQAGSGETLDLHEIRLTSRGTALLAIYSRDRRDLRPIGGKRNAQVTQGIVQEVDVESGRVLFEWKSLDHVDPAESVRPIDQPPLDSYDYFHINSVAEDRDGDLLVSARHTNAVYKVDRDTGEVIWRLGGKKSDFDVAPDAQFALQHDAQRMRGGLLRLFDNGAEEGVPSSVKYLRLDMRRMRATLARRLPQPDGMWAESQGNADAAGGGETVVGWGSIGAFSVFGPGERLLFDAHLPAEYDSYRAYMDRWVGRPAVPPALEAEREGGQVTVWASCNGATEVRAWQVLAGPSPNLLEPVGRPAPWTGLETAIVRATPGPYVAVAALGADGRRLRRSAAIRP